MAEPNDTNPTNPPETLKNLKNRQKNPLFSHRRFVIKICGICSERDAWEAIEAGADALGFNFFPGSKRYVALEQLESWLRDLPTCKIAVVVNPQYDFLDKLVQTSIVDAVQFHGDEPPEVCNRLELPWIRAVRGVPALAELSRWQTPWILCDAQTDRPGQYGGTGQLADWRKVAQLVSLANENRIFLAGGLNPQNVAKAIASVRPFGVDVAGGVELEPRQKCPKKMREFIAAARDAFQALQGKPGS